MCFCFGTLGGSRWTCWNDETLFHSLSHVEHGCLESPPPSFPQQQAFTSQLCLWPFYLSGLLAAALGLLNVNAVASSVVCPTPQTPSSLTMRHPIPLQWRLRLSKVLDSYRDPGWNILNSTEDWATITGEVTGLLCKPHHDLRSKSGPLIISWIMEVWTESSLSLFSTLLWRRY